MKRLIKSLFLLLLVSVLLLGLWIAYGLTFREDISNYVKSPETVSHNGIDITWFGTSAILLRDGKTSLFIDPYFSRYSVPHMCFNKIAPDEKRNRKWLETAGINKLTAVLVSHSHFDHVLDAPFIAQETGATLLGSETTANIARGQGLNDERIETVTTGKPINIGDFTITFIRSRHGGMVMKPTHLTKPLPSPAFAYEYPEGNVYSILIKHPNGSFLHHASARYIPGELEPYKADVVFLGIALNNNMSAYIRNVVNTVGAKTIYPIHWDDFFIPLEKPIKPLPFGVHMKQFFQDMNAYPDLKVETLPIGMKALSEAVKTTDQSRQAAE